MVNDDLELTELEAFQQKQIVMLADALAHTHACVVGDGIHCLEKYCNCQECWMAWAGDRVMEMCDAMDKKSA